LSSSDRPSLESLESEDSFVTVQAGIEITEPLNDDELCDGATPVSGEVQVEALNRRPIPTDSGLVAVEIPTTRSANDSRNVCA
jgi:hypothetical protein